MASPEQHDTPGVSTSGVFYALGALFCWSVTPLLVKDLTNDFDLWASNGWRYGVAALMWLPMLVWILAKKRFDHSIWKRALIPAFFSTVAQVAFVGAFYEIQPGMLTFGLRMQIVATAIGAFFLFPGERAIIRRWSFLAGAGAVALGTIGVGFFAGEPAEGEGNQTLGIGLAMLAGVGYAGYGMGVRKCLAGVKAEVSFSVISLYVGGSMVLLMILYGEKPIEELAAMDAETWVIFTLSVIFGLAAGHVIYFNAMERLGVAVATGVVQLQPFTVAAASYFVFGEVLNFPQLLCGVLAVGGAGTMLWTQHAVAKKRKVDAMRELDELPIDPPVAMEEAERAKSET